MTSDAELVPDEHDQREPFRVRLPGFVGDAEIGLGDAVSRTARAVGIRPCGGCVRRAGTLNNWLTISPWRSR